MERKIKIWQGAHDGHEAIPEILQKNVEFLPIFTIRILIILLKVCIISFCANRKRYATHSKGTYVR